MKVLVAPLDWGLGHATRCIPLIRALRAAGHDVIPCASGAGLRLLRAEFPELAPRELPSYAMRYTKHRALLPLWLLLQLPLFLLSAWRDGRAATRLVRETGAGFIVSDGRYGFRWGARAKVPAGKVTPVISIFVSHQLGILPPGPRALRALWAPALRVLNRRALRRFAEVWVPDFPHLPPRGLSSTLGGILAHPPGHWPHVRTIYPLCRFRPESLPWDRPFKMNEGTGESAVIDVLALLSGPEPQRSLLEVLVVRAFANLPGTRVIVRGVPAAAPLGANGRCVPGPHTSSFEVSPDGVTIFDHLPEEALLACLVRARNVVCRSGYTTMMELAGLGKRGVLLVPTPGQPEQEYLAEHAEASGFAAWQDQDALDIPAGLARAQKLPGFAVLYEPAVAGGSAGEAAFDLAGWIRHHPLLSSP